MVGSASLIAFSKQKILSEYLLFLAKKHEKYKWQDSKHMVFLMSFSDLDTA